MGSETWHNYYKIREEITNKRPNNDKQMLCWWPDHIPRGSTGLWPLLCLIIFIQTRSGAITIFYRWLNLLQSGWFGWFGKMYSQPLQQSTREPKPQAAHMKSLMTHPTSFISFYELMPPGWKFSLLQKYPVVSHKCWHPVSNHGPGMMVFAPVTQPLSPPPFDLKVWW